MTTDCFSWTFQGICLSFMLLIAGFFFCNFQNTKIFKLNLHLHMSCSFVLNSFMLQQIIIKVSCHCEAWFWWQLKYFTVTNNLSNVTRIQFHVLVDDFKKTFLENISNLIWIWCNSSAKGVMCHTFVSWLNLYRIYSFQARLRLQTLNKNKYKSFLNFHGFIQHKIYPRFSRVGNGSFEMI